MGAGALPYRHRNSGGTMHRGTIVAATAVAALALSAPVAHAATVRADCGFDAVAQETLTGGEDTFTGAAYGYAVFDDQDTHTLRCYVTVDGVEQSSTPTASGRTLVTTKGPVTYTAGWDTVVALCTEVDDLASCVASDSVPPQKVVDFIAELLCCDPGPFPPSDSLVCPALSRLAPGVPGVVDVNSEGDVTLVGVGPFWDCPPYNPPA
jgi:hypothetical protein